MKKTFSILLASLLLTAMAACNDTDDQVGPTYLDVTYVNIAGVWKLASWNGIEQNDNPYMYLILNRKVDEDRLVHTFENYQNLDSGKSRYITGVYDITAKDGEIPFISGYYDHASGLWGSDYHITELTATHMKWTVTNNPDDVSVYVRCDAVPEDIVAGTRSL